MQGMRLFLEACGPDGSNKLKQARAYLFAHAPEDGGTPSQIAVESYLT
jgi:hypothetical protein